MPRSPRRRTEDERRAGRIEGIVGLVSAALVLAIVGVLVFELTRPGAPLADLVVAETTPAAEQLGFEVVNRGRRTAAAVTVALTLREDGEIVDKRTVVIDFVPARSRATGWFVLDADDRGLVRALTVESYLDP